MPSERFVAFGYSPELDLPPQQILRVPNPHLVFFEHPHMADLMRLLNPRLRK